MDIYQRYGPALLRKARRLLQNEEDARDVVQALFIDLFEKGALDGEPPLTLPYLYRAVTRRCLNLMRDERNRLRLLELQSPALRGPVRIAPEEQAAGMQQLLGLAQRLPAEVFETLIYRFYDEMQLDEIAELTGVSRRAVSKRLARAETSLRELREEAR